MINFLLGSLEILKSNKYNQTSLNNIYDYLIKIDEDELYNLANSYDVKGYDYDIDLVEELIDEYLKIDNKEELIILKNKIKVLKNKNIL